MNLKMKIYKALTGANSKKLIRTVENFCAENLPTFHKKFLLPAKARAKSKLLKLTMASAKKKKGGVTLWKISARPAENFLPLVSVIVPNFNHEKFLRQRLETVYSQTYKNFEVILLDDNSTDESLKILREFQDLHKDNTRLIVNEKNSGSVFKQWQKGIDAAHGDLIWVAESDDYSAENFLSELVKVFADETIKIAFGRTDFIQDGVKTFDTESYLADINSCGGICRIRTWREKCYSQCQRRSLPQTYGDS